MRPSTRRGLISAWVIAVTHALCGCHRIEVLHLEIGDHGADELIRSRDRELFDRVIADFVRTSRGRERTIEASETGADPIGAWVLPHHDREPGDVDEPLAIFRIYLTAIAPDGDDPLSVYLAHYSPGWSGCDAFRRTADALRAALEEVFPGRVNAPPWPPPVE